MSEAPPEALDDQRERTLLAWRRTALALLAAGLLVGHVTARRTAVPVLVVTLLVSAGVVAFVWLGHARSTGVVALALVLGVMVLGAVALVGVAAG